MVCGPPKTDWTGLLALPLLAALAPAPLLTAVNCCPAFSSSALSVGERLTSELVSPSSVFMASALRIGTGGGRPAAAGGRRRRGGAGGGAAESWRVRADDDGLRSTYAHEARVASSGASPTRTTHHAPHTPVSGPRSQAPSARSRWTRRGRWLDRRNAPTPTAGPRCAACVWPTCVSPGVVCMYVLARVQAAGGGGGSAGGGAGGCGLRCCCCCWWARRKRAGDAVRLRLEERGIGGFGERGRARRIMDMLRAGRAGPLGRLPCSLHRSGCGVEEKRKRQGCWREPINVTARSQSPPYFRRSTPAHLPAPTPEPVVELNFRPRVGSRTHQLPGAPDAQQPPEPGCSSPRIRPQATQGPAPRCAAI